MTPNDFLKTIQIELHSGETIPEGWYSTKTLAKMWGNVSQTFVHDKVNAGIRIGIATKKYFKVKFNNKIIAIPHYKFHEKEICKDKDKRTKVDNKIRGCGENRRCKK